MKPPPPQPPPKPFPWFRTTLVLGGLTAGVIIFSRYHTDLPWCQKVDQISRPAIEKTCDTSAQAWDWARGKWTNIGRETPGTNGSTPPSSTGAGSSIGSSTDPALPSMSVYFTPTDTGSRAAVSRVLCSMIRSAQSSVVASYADFDDDDVAQALVAASKTKGVSVQAGVDNHNCMKPAVQTLIRAGIPVATDRSGNAVSANFLIIDGQMVCYGSVMPTAKSLYHDNNCLFTIADRKLAARFTACFRELYPAVGSAPATGSALPAATPLVLDGLQACLGSDGEILNRVIEQINTAETSLMLLTPALGNDAINEALAKAARRGVPVQICLDRAAILSPEEQLILENNKVVLTRTAAAGTLGETALIIDRRTVVEFGGMARSLALTNQRGIALIMHSRGMAGIFEEEFDRVSHNRPAAPDGFAYELLRGHTVTPLMVATPAVPITPAPIIPTVPPPVAQPQAAVPATQPVAQPVGKPVATTPAAHPTTHRPKPPAKPSAKSRTGHTNTPPPSSIRPK